MSAEAKGGKGGYSSHGGHGGDGGAKGQAGQPGGVAISGPGGGHAYASPGEISIVGFGGNGKTVRCLNSTCNAIVPETPGKPGDFLCQKCGHHFGAGGGGAGGEALYGIFMGWTSPDTVPATLVFQVGGGTTDQYVVTGGVAVNGVLGGDHATADAYADKIWRTTLKNHVINSRTSAPASSSGESAVIWHLPAHVRDRLEMEEKTRLKNIRTPDKSGFLDGIRAIKAAIARIFG